MSVSRKQIAQLCRSLTQQLAVQNGASSTGKPGRRARNRRRRRARRGRTNGMENIPTGQPGMPSTTGPRRRPTRLTGGEGSLRVARDELLATVRTGSTGDAAGSVSVTIPIVPIPSSTDASAFPWLSGIAASYERIVWNSLSFSWRSAVGTTTDGLVCYGVNWESPTKAAKPTRAEVTSLMPVKDHPLWKSTDESPLHCPKGYLQSRRHYVMRSTDLDDSSPGSFQLSVINGPSGKDVGEVWISYDVTLLGPRKASS